MTHKNALIALGVLLALAVGIYFLFPNFSLNDRVAQNVDPTPQNVTLSGTYLCLPHLDTSGPQTMECAFGFQTDDGVYYAVNFGQSATASEQFQSGAHVTAEGFVVPKEALNSDQWAKYNMKGIFTVTKVIDPAPVQQNVQGGTQGKINISVVCEGALAYMTFPDGASADAFVKDCEDGKHPEVIEHYKAQMGFGDGAAI